MSDIRIRSASMTFTLDKKPTVAHTTTPKKARCIRVACKGFNDENIGEDILARPIIHYGPVLVSISQSFAARVAVHHLFGGTEGELLINPLSFIQPTQSHVVSGFHAARSLSDLQLLSVLKK